MSFVKYQALVTSIELKSITKAAETLGYTQPGISHMISSMEMEMGFPLLNRYKSGVTPTDNAKALLPYMRQILSAEDSIQQTVDLINGVETGSLKIGTFNSMSVEWLPEIIAEFSAEHQNVSLSISEGNHDEIESLIVNQAVDLAFTSLPIPTGYDFIPLSEDPILAVVSPNNPLSRCKSIDLKELVKYPFIIPEKGGDESVRDVVNQEQILPDIRLRIKGDNATAAMISKDLGVSLIPELVLLPFKNIIARPLTVPHYRTLGILLPSARHASPAAKEFIAITKHFISEVWNHK